MKKLLFLFTLSLLMIGMAWGQGTETFDNLTIAGTDYQTGTFTGQDGSEWSFTKCRGDQPITGKSLMIGRNQSPQSFFQSGTISGGIGTLSFDYKKSFSTNVNLNVYVNDTLVHNVTTSSTSVQNSGIITVGVAGDFVLKFINANSSNGQVQVDNVTWTSHTSGANTPPTISNISINPSTGITSSTDVTVSATITDAEGTVEAADVYWGTTSGNRTNSVTMSNTSGDTWEGTIPAQANNTTVYYSVYAMDDEADDVETAEYSYTVSDPVPLITVNPSTLSGFTYVVDEGPSTHQTFTVSGSTLTADITVTASTNYEISEDGATYTSPITLTETGGSVDNTTIYVRLKAGLEADTYNSEVITASSTGADDKTVTCNGYVSSPPPPGYFVDFEGSGETKTGYASETVNLSGLDWDMTEALIGDIAGDWKNGLKSARMRGYAASSMTMLEDVADGVGTVSFSYRRYGTDAQVDWKVEYSTDQGTSWTQLGSDFTAPDADDVQNFTEALDINDPVRIRIKRATDDSNASNKRLNIDDISLSEYTPSYDITPDTPATYGNEGAETSITITGGGFVGANIISEGLTPAANAAFITSSAGILQLIGTGSVTLSFTPAAGDTWFTYSISGGDWVVIDLTDPGTVIPIEIIVDLGSKDAAFEFKSGTGGDPTLPVELSTFTVALNNYNNAVLTWVTQTETGVSGFYVYRNNSENLASATLVSHLIPATNSSEEHSYSFIDNELFSHGTYYYWLQVADIDGSESYHGPATLVYTGDNEPALPSIPSVTELRSIFPNPFNPNTNLSYSLAEEADVNVKIFNSRGQLVRTLNEGRKAVGHHSAAWDGKDDRGQNQSTGVYFFRMQAGKKVFNSKAVLMK